MIPALSDYLNGDSQLCVFVTEPIRARVRARMGDDAPWTTWNKATNTEMDWNIYLVALEIDVRQGRAPMNRVLNGWAQYAYLLEQPEPGHPMRMKKKWAKLLSSAAWCGCIQQTSAHHKFRQD